MHPTKYFQLEKGSIYVAIRGISETQPGPFLAQGCSLRDPLAQAPDRENDWWQDGRKKLAYKQRLKQFVLLSCTAEGWYIRLWGGYKGNYFLIVPQRGNKPQGRRAI